jgi:hypothetical protein
MAPAGVSAYGYRLIRNETLIQDGKSAVQRGPVIKIKTLNPELLRKIDTYWRAANYLSVGQIYLYDNPLLKKPLKLSRRSATVGLHPIEKGWRTAL